MASILADNNAEGHLQVLVQIWQKTWQDIWSSLNYSIVTFEDLNVSRQVSDEMLWLVCQQKQVVLITNNRNADRPDSLEAVIRSQNTAAALPVITFANGDRLLQEREYAERAAEKILEYLLELDAVRGTGRLFVP